MKPNVGIQIEKFIIYLNKPQQQGDCLLFDENSYGMNFQQILLKISYRLLPKILQEITRVPVRDFCVQPLQ